MSTTIKLPEHPTRFGIVAYNDMYYETANELINFIIRPDLKRYTPAERMHWLEVLMMLRDELSGDIDTLDTLEPPC